MQRFIILHTNDIHARIEGLARIATLVEQIRTENAPTQVLYFDAGDIEDNSIRLSSLTKGVAMHRLLSVSGCDAAAVGNGGIGSYGYQMLPEYSKAADYLLLLANLYTPEGKLVPGVQPTALLNVGTLRLGLIGVTAPIEDIYGEAGFGLQLPTLLPLVKECAAQLRHDGAQAIILLSHLGLEADREIAPDLPEEIVLIIGAHSHHLLPEGEWVKQVLVVQAGEYAQHLGRLDLLWDGEHVAVERVSVLPVLQTTPQATRILGEVTAIDTEVAQFLNGIIGELAEPLDYTPDRECGTTNLMADALREHMNADVAIITPGAAFAGPLPAGPLRRITLWEACPTPGNPTIATMTGAQLSATVTRGLDPDFAQERPRPFRGRARGLMHLSGARVQAGQFLVDGQPIEPERHYKVAACDWELSEYGGYVDPQWKLQLHFEMPTILRDVLEAYIPAHSPLRVEMGRLS